MQPSPERTHVATADGGVLAADALTKRFEKRSGLGQTVAVTAVDAVSLAVEPGRTVAVVGESGSGKSTLARLMLGLMAPDAGTVRFRGADVSSLRGETRREFRRSVQMVFQNPLRSFSPMLTLGGTIEDALRLRSALGARERRAEVGRLLEQVHLPAEFAGRYPAEVSGGQLQRAGIARALAPGPQVVVLDEPTSALDMSLHGQVVNLLLELQAEHGLAYVLISHDLRIVRAMADRVVVMYLGQTMEEGPAGAVLDAAGHPYTLALLAAEPGAAHRPDLALVGELRPRAAENGGCKLVDRCPFADEPSCEPQRLRDLGGGHLVRCWRAEEIRDGLRPVARTGNGTADR
jgi:oligopeptide/dipeptide ABC transporter ATP-binding protein